MKFGPVVHEMSLNEKVYGRRTDNRQRPITIAHLCALFLTDLYLKCRYEDLRSINNKTNIHEKKQIWVSSTFFLTCKQEMKYNISNITLWKNFKCVMLILFFFYIMRTRIILPNIRVILLYAVRRLI